MNISLKLNHIAKTSGMTVRQVTEIGELDQLFRAGQFESLMSPEKSGPVHPYQKQQKPKRE